MRLSSTAILFLASTFSLELIHVQGFTVLPSHRHFSTELLGRKKGNLGKNVSSGGVSTRSKKKGGNGKQVATADNGPAKISNSLSQWAATLDGSSDAASVSRNMDTTTTGSSSDADDGASFQPFEAEDTSSTSSEKNSNSKNQKSSRRQRSSERQQSDAILNAQIDGLLSDIKELISSNNLPVPDLLSKIKSLTEINSPLTLKALLNSKARDYSLAWVGSDDAICHVGTGLHKVPLARLQEIFFTVGRDVSGKSKTVRLMEVISILGPFPNVRNTLQGEIVKQSTEESVRDGDPVRRNSVSIMYDSMMDGLGKEIDAGTVDNMRTVELDIVFVDARALVCVLPIEDGEKTEFGENGKNVLLFLKEDDLDYRLEELRAA